MTPEELVRMMPFAGTRATLFAEPLTRTLAEFDITAPRRQAAFLANIAVESGSLKYVLEIAPGDTYEGRKDLGNTEPGDGRRFKGRGLPQITGRANYLACGQALGLDLIATPELLEVPLHAARSAGWFWQTRHLGPLADEDKFGSIVRLWNGGYNALDERIAHWLRIRRVLAL